MRTTCFEFASHPHPIGLHIHTGSSFFSFYLSFFRTHTHTHIERERFSMCVRESISPCVCVRPRSWGLIFRIFKSCYYYTAVAAVCICDVMHACIYHNDNDDLLILQSTNNSFNLFCRQQMPGWCHAGNIYISGRYFFLHHLFQCCQC